MTIIVRAIVKRRRLLKLSQRRVARAVGCNQSYLAQVETGRRPISGRVAEKLESLLKVKPGSYSKAPVRRGRPPLSRETCRALREIRRARGAAPRSFPQLGRPRHPRPDRASGLKNQLWPIALHLGPEAAQEVNHLERMRPACDSFWRHLQSIRYDSWSEKRLHVRVGLAGAALTGVSPGKLGCVLPNADGSSGRESSRRAYPAFVWRSQEVALAMFPQRCVATQCTHLWPDILLVAACQGRRVTGVVEVDGKPHHGNLKAQKRRDGALDVPVLHLDAAEVGQPGLLDKLVRWVRSLFV
jgi:transcriptional regulator with XRE-family HTH domain